MGTKSEEKLTLGPFAGNVVTKVPIEPGLLGSVTVEVRMLDDADTALCSEETLACMAFLKLANFLEQQFDVTGVRIEERTGG